MKNKRLLSRSQLQWNKSLEETMKKDKEIKKGKENNKKELQKEYEELKLKYFKTDTDETLKKYYILSKAYELGKKLYGQQFSKNILALHFDIGLTTVKRILSLNNANERTWKFIKDGKISASRVTMILLRWDSLRQDEIIDIVLKDNLTTYQIKKLPIKGDIKKEKLKIAVEQGFARQSVAFKSFKDTVTRLNKLLELEEDTFPPKKIPEIIEMLDELKINIERKLVDLIG